MKTKMNARKLWAPESKDEAINVLFDALFDHAVVWCGPRWMEILIFKPGTPIPDIGDSGGFDEDAIEKRIYLLPIEEYCNLRMVGKMVAVNDVIDIVLEKWK